MNLGGIFTKAGLGTFNRTGGTVNLTGTLDNTGTTLGADDHDRFLESVGRHPQKRHAHGSGGAALVFTASGGTLDGVTVNGDLDLTQISGAFAFVQNGLCSTARPAWAMRWAATYGGLELHQHADPLRHGHGAVW